MVKRARELLKYHILRQYFATIASLLSYRKEYSHTAVHTKKYTSLLLEKRSMKVFDLSKLCVHRNKICACFQQTGRGELKAAMNPH